MVGESGQLHHQQGRALSIDQYFGHLRFRGLSGTLMDTVGDLLIFLSIFFCCRLHFFNDRFDCLVALPCQRGVAGEQLRTNVHQLRQREPTILLQQAHFQAGTAGIRQGEDPVAEHQLHGQSARHQLDRQEAHRCPAPARRRVQLPQSHRRFLLGKMPLQPRPQRALLQA